MTTKTTKTVKMNLRCKKSDIQHKHFGVGVVLHKIATDAGNGLLVKFADKLRIILVDSPGWTNPDDAQAAFNAAPGEPKVKERVKPIRVRPVDETVEVGEEGGDSRVG